MIDVINSLHAAEILTFYDCGRFTGMEKVKQGFANRNFILYTDKDKYLLRQYKQQGIEEIDWELSILTALQREKFPTSYPVPRKDLLLKTIYQDEVIVLFNFLPGLQPDLNSKTVKEIAGTVARLNLFNNWHKYPRKNAVHIENAQALIVEFTLATCQYPEVFDFFKRELKYLTPWLEKKLPQGLVHGDVFPDNTLFLNDKLIGLIDFEEGAIDALMFDVGITINGFCIRNNRLDLDLLEIFLSRYGSIRPLIQAEKEALPAYIHWGALAMIYWHLRNDLLYTRNEVQLDRILELMNRIRDYKRRRMEINDYLEGFWKIDLPI